VTQKKHLLVPSVTESQHLPVALAPLAQVPLSLVLLRLAIEPSEEECPLRAPTDVRERAFVALPLESVSHD